MQLSYRPNTTALNLLVDGTGIKFIGEGEWKRKKHSLEYRRQWRKVHLDIDEQTLEMRAIEVTDNSVGDTPMLHDLLHRIPSDEDLTRQVPDEYLPKSRRPLLVGGEVLAALVPDWKDWTKAC